MTAPTTDKRRLVDLLLPGGIDSYIRTRRDAGQSWRQISLAIREDTQIDVHPHTLRDWTKAVAA